MLWIILAILAHVGNGLVFIVDKSLLKTKSAIGNPTFYALYSAGFAGLSVILIPWAHISLTTFLLTWAFIAGAIHIGALYVFFTAMQKGEPSRVVPITGSVVPLFTVMFALTFLGEQFTAKEGLGIVLLIVGGMMLAIKGLSGSRMSIVFPICAGVLFAGYFAITKYIYAHEVGQFLGIFIVTRVAEALIAGVGILIITKGFSALRMAKKKVRKNTKKKSLLTSLAFIFNKSLAAGAFLLQTYAISLGSVSVVNALQGVQYAFVLVLAICVSLFFPKLFQEEVGRGAVIQKIAGIVCVSCGIALLV